VAGNTSAPLIDPARFDQSVADGGPSVVVVVDEVDDVVDVVGAPP
jgi:hypothetical protein